MNCHNNIDTIITEYDIRTDKVLSTIWKDLTDQMWHRIETYGGDVNNYGPDTLAPHLTRIAEDSRDFLLFLNHPDNVAHNFYDAIKISDLGKTAIEARKWKVDRKELTDELRAEKRKHTIRGPEVLAEFLRNAPDELLNHPHVKTVVPVHMTDHHFPLSKRSQMGTMMEIACIVDAYDGDMDLAKIGKDRTVDEQYDRMIASDTHDKYHGYFRAALIDHYFKFRQQKYG